MSDSRGMSIVGSVFDPRRPNDKRVRVKGKLYRVYIYIAGNNLPYIAEVTYHLHKTFKNRNIRIKRTLDNPNCVISTWTWGLYEVQATVIDKRGGRYQLRHQLSWDKELNDHTIYEYVD